MTITEEKARTKAEKLREKLAATEAVIERASRRANHPKVRNQHARKEGESLRVGEPLRAAVAFKTTESFKSELLQRAADKGMTISRYIAEVVHQAHGGVDA